MSSHLGPSRASLPILLRRRPAAFRARGRCWRRGAVLLVAATCLAGCSRGEERPIDASAAEELSAGALTDDLVSGGESARQVAAHQLTPERVERWFAAQEALDAVLADDPALDARIRGSGGLTGQGGAGAITQAVSRLEGEPEARSAIRGAGVSVREFVLTGLALHQALLASGPAAPATLRRLAARNVQFVTQNAELLQRYASQRPTYVATAPAPPDTLFYDYASGIDTIVYDGASDVDTVGSGLLDSLDRADTLSRGDSSVRLAPIFPRDTAAGVSRRDTTARRAARDSAARPPASPPPPPPSPPDRPGPGAPPPSEPPPA